MAETRSTLEQAQHGTACCIWNRRRDLESRLETDFALRSMEILSLRKSKSTRGEANLPQISTHRALRYFSRFPTNRTAIRFTRENNIWWLMVFICRFSDVSQENIPMRWTGNSLRHIQIRIDETAHYRCIMLPYVAKYFLKILSPRIDVLW